MLAKNIAVKIKSKVSHIIIFLVTYPECIEAIKYTPTEINKSINRARAKRLSRALKILLEQFALIINLICQ